MSSYVASGLLGESIQISISGLGSLRGNAERAVEAGQEADSPEDRSLPRLGESSTPADPATRIEGGVDGFVKRKLEMGGFQGATFEEEDVAPQTFERRRKKNKTGCGDVSGGPGDGVGSEGQRAWSDKENATDINAMTPMSKATTETKTTPAVTVMRMMTESDVGASIVGKELVVYWPGTYSAWYRATVQRFDERAKKMTVYYPGDTFKDTLDLRKVRDLIRKGWVKVSDERLISDEVTLAAATTKDITKDIELTPSRFECGEKDAGCSKCRWKGCRECRGYTLAEKRRWEAQQGGAKMSVEKMSVEHKDTTAVKKHVPARQEKEEDENSCKHNIRPMRESDFGPTLEGKELSVFWARKFNNWYRAEVESFNPRTKKAWLYYPEDDFREALDLKKIKSLIDKDRIKIVVSDGDNEPNNAGEDADVFSQLSHHTNDDEDLDLSQELSQEQGLRYITKEEFGVGLQGRTLSVFWGRGFNAWFRATVQRFDDRTRKAYLYYAADNHHETMDAKKFANLVSKARIKLVEEDDMMVHHADASSTKEVVRLMTRQDMGRGLKGKDVVVFWTDERYKGWYEATVRSFNQDEGLVTLWYRKDKTRETVDPTLMYIPEGRIGFIEERPGDHQLVRGELDLMLLDIKGRVARSCARAAMSKFGTNGAEQRPAVVARDQDSQGESDEVSEEEPSPSQEEDVAEELADAPAIEPVLVPPPDNQDFKCGYPARVGDDGQIDDARDVQNLAALDATQDAVKSKEGLDNYVADSHDASPNPSPQQAAPISNLKTMSGEIDQACAPFADQGDVLEDLPLTQREPETEPLVDPEVEASPSQPSVDPWGNNQAALIYRWLSASLAHPLSKQATLAKLRPSLQEAVDFIRDNVQDTIERSFNNSILVVGAPGSGKTLAVSRVISQVEGEWNGSATASSTSTSPNPRVGIVRLSGVEFSDERAAFREIARQLCESLNLDYVKTASLGDNIQFLLQILKALAQAGKAAVFILEEFDLFAHTQKQTFLYCLLDSLQKSQAKAVVIGTTCRHDCLDLLEKRVKSRFSHRSVTLTPPTTLEDKEVHGSGAKSILTDILSLPEGSFEGSSVRATQHNDQVRQAMEDRRVLDGLSRILQFSNSLHTLSRIARKALGIWYASCHDGNDGDATADVPFAAHHLVKAIDDIFAATSSGFESVISKLCPLDLSVLAAAHKAKSGRNDGLLNFEMVHHEFKTYTTSNSLHVDNYSRAAASKSFERLVACGILQHPRNKGGSLSRRDRHFAPVLVQVTRTELQQGLQKHFNAPRQLIDWALRGEIHTTALNEYN